MSAGGLAINGGQPIRQMEWPRWPSFTREEITLVADTLRGGQVNYWTGSQGRRFEQEYAEYVGVPHAIAVMNGTIALELALRAYGVGPGDEVIVPCRTFIASVAAVVTVGATPVLCDVDLGTQNLTAASVSGVLSARTRAVIAVHLAGMPCEMTSLQELCAQHDLVLIEDCAQAHGAKYRGMPVGSFGDAAAFSFCQDKIITTGGEGGMLLLRSAEAYDTAVRLKDHGTSPELVRKAAESGSRCFAYIHDSFGSNYRMTEMQAVLGLHQLRQLTRSVDERRENARRLLDGLRLVPGVLIDGEPEWAHHSRYKAYVRLDLEALIPGWSRDAVVDAVFAEGIPLGSGSCPDLGNEPAFAGPTGVARPVARQLGMTTVMFQVHPTLGPTEMDDACAAVSKVMRFATGG